MPATWAAATPGVVGFVRRSTRRVRVGPPPPRKPPRRAIPDMPGMAAAAAKGAGAFGAGPRYGFKPIVMPKQVVV